MRRTGFGRRVIRTAEVRKVHVKRRGCLVQKQIAILGPVTSERRLPEAWSAESLRLAGLAPTLLDDLGAAVIAVDGDGAVTYANAEAGRAFGWSHDAVLGRPLDTLLDGGDAPAGVLAGRRWQG